MKRYGLPLLIVLLPLAATLLWVWTPRTVPPEEASDLYRQYCRTPGIKAAFIHDFPLNDTEAVDVTVLTAVDTATWHWLRTQFGFGDSLFSSMKQSAVFLRMAPKEHPEQQKGATALRYCDEIIGSGYTKTIEVFHITDTTQFGMFSKYLLNKMLNE